MTQHDKITVYYDGKCGLCSREINHYKKIAPDGVFNWQDVTSDDRALNQDGIALSEALKSLHAKDRDGQFHTGVDAFILIWKELKGWKYLGYILALPIIRPCAQFAYKNFANWRFQRLEHCQIALEKERKQ